MSRGPAVHTRKLLELLTRANLPNNNKQYNKIMEIGDQLLAYWSIDNILNFVCTLEFKKVNNTNIRELKVLIVNNLGHIACPIVDNISNMTRSHEHRFGKLVINGSSGFTSKPNASIKNLEEDRKSSYIGENR